MELTEQRKQEKKARDLIDKALKELYGNGKGLPEFLKERISVEKYHEELTRTGIDAGVAALVLINNMSAASLPGMDLFELLQAYLLDKSKRSQINSIIKKTPIDC